MKPRLVKVLGLWLCIPPETDKSTGLGESPLSAYRDYQRSNKIGVFNMREGDKVPESEIRGRIEAGCVDAFLLLCALAVMFAGLSFFEVW